MYRCFEGPCYQLTTHLPGTATLCLAEVASVSNDGLNPNNAGSGDVTLTERPASLSKSVAGSGEVNESW